MCVWCNNTCVCMVFHEYMCIVVEGINWASEVSPTLGCTIKISRDICICYSMGRSDIRDIFHEV